MKKYFLLPILSLLLQPLFADPASHVDSVVLKLRAFSADSSVHAMSYIFSHKDTAKTQISTVKPAAPAKSTPSSSDFLISLVIGAMLGMAGQGARVVIGLKKAGQLASENELAVKDLINYQQAIFSLTIGLIIGAIAGIIAAMNSSGAITEKSVLLAILAAGYAGTDFIEGAFRKEETHPVVKEQIEKNAATNSK